MGRNYAEFTNANQKHTVRMTYRRLCGRIRCVHLIRGYTVNTDMKIAFDLTLLC